jgi:hypothetical protein
MSLDARTGAMVPAPDAAATVIAATDPASILTLAYLAFSNEGKLAKETPGRQFPRLRSPRVG